MICLSSIFSFETFRLRPWFPKATLVALALLAAAELAARYAVHTHRLYVDASARQLIEDHRIAVSKNQNAIWLLGNSTLGYGVDEKLLARRTGARLLKLPHGSATVSASAKLLDYYLGIASHPPKEVVLFISKDDLNRNGYRADVSAEYEALCRQPMRKPQEFSMLWQARSHIAERIESTFEHVLHHGETKKPAPAGEPHFDGTIASDDVMYTRLVRNFAMDHNAVSAVAAAAHRHGVTNIVIVLVPCTDVYVRFHDTLFPKQPYADLRAELAAECRQTGVKFFDFGDPSTNYVEFYDGYHLNNAGAARFTDVLARSHIIAGPASAERTHVSPSSATVDSALPSSPAHADIGVAN